MATPNRPPTILLAEDDEDDRVIIRSALRRSGIAHDLEVLGDGMALLERLRRAPSGDDARGAPAPVIVLLDLDMPRKSGWDVLREIRADRALRHIPVVVLTDSNRPDEQERCFALGASAFVRKAFTIDEMRDALEATSQFFTRLGPPGTEPSA